MRRLIYLILCAAAFLVPTRPQELGKLKPVEVIRIEIKGEQLLIETDTGDSGQGTTVNQALWSLRETTAGTVYLDTAEYLLVPKEGMDRIDELRSYLKESVRICEWEGEMKLEEVAEYLNVHRPRVTLEQYRKDTPLQTLEIKNGRIKLTEKSVERRQKTT